MCHLIRVSDVECASFVRVQFPGNLVNQLDPSQPVPVLDSQVARQSPELVGLDFWQALDEHWSTQRNESGRSVTGLAGGWHDQNP